MLRQSICARRILATAYFYLVCPAIFAQLVDQHASDFQIFSSSTATATEQYAAHELQDYIARITGCKLPIVHEAGTGTKLIYVGFQKVPRSVLGAINPESFGKEEYVIKRVGDALLIAGGQPRGTLYGVIGLLRDHLGCRWYTREVTKIPKVATLRIEDLPDRQAPAFEYREPYYRECYDVDFAVHNRINPSGARLPQEKGGSFTIFPFVHTFNRLVPVAKYFEEHPEYFSLVNGVRQNKHFGAQLCLTNPEVVQIATESVLRWIEEHPETDLFSVDQNDGYGYCECEVCAALDEAEGSHAGTVLHFVNQIAEVVAEKHPNVRLQTLAYVYSEVPPKTIKPRPNVTIRMCHYDYCEAHAIGQCDDHLPFVERLEGWSNITDSIIIWDYYTDFRHYLIPFPNFESVINHPRFYAEHSCTGLFAQGNNVQRQGGGEFSALRAWVFAQLMWNPYQNGHALVDEFVENVYGPAAPFIRKYIQLAHEAVQPKDIRFSIFADPAQLTFLTPELIAQADTLFRQAEAVVQNDPTLLKRVELAHLPIHYTRLFFFTIGGRAYLSVEEMPAILAEFKRILVDHHIQQLGEQNGKQAIADFIQRVEKRLSFVTDWWILGPFDNTDRAGFDMVYPPETIIDLTRKYTGIRQQTIKWTHYENELSGYIDFAKLLQPSEVGVAYAYRTFDARQETNMVVGIGSNDGVKLWVNDQLLLNKKASRVAAPNQETLTIPLKRGMNTVLIKIDQLGGGWGFYFSQQK
jgi:hypothetical protein